MFWFSATIAGAIELGFIWDLPRDLQNHHPTKKAEGERQKTGNLNLKPKDDPEMSASLAFRRAIIRPVKMLLYSPMIFILALYTSVTYGYLYLVMTTITPIFESIYGFSEGQVGFTFLGLGKCILDAVYDAKGLAIVIIGGVLACGATLDWYFKRKELAGSLKPENRLPLLSVGGTFMPIGLLIYGWTLQSQTHWIVPIISTVLLGFGLNATTVPISTCLVDVFGISSASAIAATSVLKYTSVAALPLAGSPLYGRFGLGWGNSVLAFIAMALVPVPLLLMQYGGRLRMNDKRGLYR